MWILYADDLALFCKTVHESERLLTIINDTCLRFGLTISFAKTKTQVFNNNELADKSSLLNINEQVIDNVRTFTYLGHVITTEGGKCFTGHRRAAATAKFNQLRNVLCDIHVNVRTRRKILESCVRSRLIYGTQAWYPKEQEMSKLEACWNELQRSMVKGGWSRKKAENEAEEEYAFKYSNEGIRKILKTTPLRDSINNQYLKYVGHVSRMPNDAIPKQLLFAIPQLSHYRDPWLKIASMLDLPSEQVKKLTQSRNRFSELVRQRAGSTSG